jgi:single-strand DNA-binding protein
MYNKVMLIGRLGQDVDFRTVAGGTPLAKFTMATDETRRSENGERTTTTEWHRIIVWRRLAEVARDYLKKGSLIHLEGRIHYDSYENKEGQKVYTTEIVCDNFKMLGSRSDQGGGGGQWDRKAQSNSQSSPKPAAQAKPAAAQGGGSFNDSGDDDLPF